MASGKAKPAYKRQTPAPVPQLALAMVMMFAVACSPVDIQPAATEGFAKKDYQYYRWARLPILKGTSRDFPRRPIDPTVRQAVDDTLQKKGYLLDPQKAQFNIDYRYGIGIREGVAGDDASNITYVPPGTINRKIDQASRDNAIALGGVKETKNLQLRIRDTTSQQEVWEVTLTEIVSNTNNTGGGQIDKSLSDAIPRALRSLPDVKR